MEELNERNTTVEVNTELLEDLAAKPLHSAEFRIILCLLRRDLAPYQIEDITDIKQANVSQALHRLHDKHIINVVKQSKKGRFLLVSLNKSMKESAIDATEERNERLYTDGLGAS